jgi:phage/plasmid-associated DNA primase
MSEYDYGAEQDPNVAALEQAYYENPLGTTAALVAAAVQQAVAGTAQAINHSNEAVYASQASIAATQAAANLRAKYGEDWDRQESYTHAVLERNPHLIPADNGVLDVPTVEQSLEDAYHLGRKNAEDEYQSRRWDEIRNAPSNRLNFD